MRLVDYATDKDMLHAYEVASGRKPKRYKKRRGIWTGLPDCQWYDIRLTAGELSSVSLIRNELNWLALGGYFREPLVAAHWIKSHPELPDDTINYYEKMCGGEYPEFPCIFVGNGSKPENMVVLDGNHRVTAACMGRIDMDRFPILLGVHRDIDKWTFYRDGKRIRRTLNEVGW